MTHVTADRVLETSTTTGLVALTLAGAVTGFRTFGSVCANADTAYYSVWAVDANGIPTGAWETGLGTWGTGGVLTRTSVKASSAAGAAVDFAAGTKRVALSEIAFAFAATQTALAGKQATLVSATNIKTVGGTTLLGAGDITFPAQEVTLAGAQTLSGKTYVDPIIAGTIKEDIFTITDTSFVIDPTNGSLQAVGLTAARTPTQANWDDGESVTLMVSDGTNFTINWGTIVVTWVGGTLPTLALAGNTVIQLWKIGGNIYGAHVGNVA